MQLYLEYAQYQDMGGRLPLGTYTDLAVDAQAEIDWYTFGRVRKLEEIPDEVKWCVYKLVGVLAAKQAAQGSASSEVSGLNAGIASQSNDGVSISYNVVSAQEIVQSSKSEMEAIIRKYLETVKDVNGRRILYRGVYPNE